jgi:hypothetical protein
VKTFLGRMTNRGGLVLTTLMSLAAWLAGIRIEAAVVIGVVVVAVRAAAAALIPARGNVDAAAPGRADPGESPEGAPLARPEDPGALFRAEGEFWTIALQREAFRLKDAKGLRYLHVLLGAPGREFYALDLAGLVEGSWPSRQGPGEALEVALSGGPGDAGPLLDLQAKQAYRRRLVELKERIEEREVLDDAEGARRLREEMEFLAAELRRADGLGGRDRRAASPVERARVNVTRAIRSSIEKIQEYDPSLGHHLAASVKTGTFCSYDPGPVGPVWRL